MNAKLFFAALVAAFPALSHAQLNVANATSGASLVNTLLGSGVTVIGSPTYVGIQDQGGTFSNGLASGLGIDSGILLTTGTIQNATGGYSNGQWMYGNSSTGIETDDGEGGNALLDTLTGSNVGTFDANTLSFSFHTDTAGTISFSYVFGSDEYNEFVGDYNDVFGFFLDGVNIGLIPGTSTPVSIDTVNLNENSQYFINNSIAGSYNDDNYYVEPDPAAGGPPATVQYDGLTVPLTASAYVSAGDHTILLGVEDVYDQWVDSGVFIEGGSFSEDVAPTLTVPTSAPDSGTTMFSFAAALTALAALRRRRAGR